MKPKNCGSTNQVLSAWASTISVSDSEPVIITTPTSDRPCATS